MNEQQLFEQIQNHKGMASVLAIWAMRELPVAWKWLRESAWPALVSVYPYCRDNGGVRGIIHNFFVGKSNDSKPTNP